MALEELWCLPISGRALCVCEQKEPAKNWQGCITYGGGAAFEYLIQHIECAALLVWLFDQLQKSWCVDK